MSDSEGPHVGRRRTRREDHAFLTGDGSYTPDRIPEDAAHLAFVRSRHGHADITDIDTAAATGRDGVLAVYTWADLAASDAPMELAARTAILDCSVPGHPVLARDRVRYQGQPVAAVLATDRYTAYDAADAVTVTYDARPTVTDPEAAMQASAPTLFEDAPDNVAVTGDLGEKGPTDDAIAAADHVVSLDLENNRLIPTPLEPRAAVATYDAGDDDLTVEMTSQAPHGHRGNLSSTLGRPEGQIRVIAPDVGGGFGHKGHHHPGEAMAAWAAMRAERPVAWVNTRTENAAAGAHGRDHRTTAELGVDADGTLRGLRVETVAGVGGYALGGGPALATWYGRLLASQYDLPAIHCRTTAVFTTTAPVHSYRGAGRPEAVYVTERLIDVAADELDLDPVTIRRQNQLDPAAFPHETVVGATYDSGDYEPALEAAIDAIDYDARRADQERPTDGEYLGIGIANYVESTGGGYESGVVRVHPDGTVTVYAGTHSHGQGHETTYAQIVADELGIDPDSIDVVEGDTESIPTGTGTFGSRSTITGGNAVRESAQDVAAKVREIAAHDLEADPADLTLTDGTVQVAGAPTQSVAFATVADTAYGRSRPPDVSPGLEATTFYEPDGGAYAFGTHAAVVSVDPATGDVTVKDYVAVDDCGERINPMLVDGQVHGGVAQGIGQALFEHAVYDDSGNLATGSLQDYALPRAEDLPAVETRATVTPSPTNPLGVKGIGEAGTIAAPPTIVNAVVDALAPFDIDHIDMPITAERVWQTLQET
ncbi:MAG: xanthine dehydrogenase family protein molybdopterin-binding subunit [Halobacteriaceae archaeon]